MRESRTSGSMSGDGKRTQAPTGAQTPRPSSTLLPLVRHGRRVMLMDASSIQIGVGRSGSWRAGRLGNWLVRSLATKAALGGRAKRRAVTRVNPEHASKVELWAPTRAENGEGRTEGEVSDKRTPSAHRGNGDGTPRRHHGQRGRPEAVREGKPQPGASPGPIGRREGHSTEEAG